MPRGFPVDQTIKAKASGEWTDANLYKQTQPMKITTNQT